MQLEYDIDQVSMGNRLRMERNLLKVSQDVLAGRIGCSTKYLSSLECGRAIPSIQFLMKFSDITGASLDYLMFGTSPRQRGGSPNEVHEELLYYGNQLTGLSKRQRNYIREVLPKIAGVLAENIV
jgi:transcriptional regulator with XRE-family HTH domain